MKKNTATTILLIFRLQKFQPNAKLEIHFTENGIIVQIPEFQKQILFFHMAEREPTLKKGPYNDLTRYQGAPYITAAAAMSDSPSQPHKNTVIHEGRMLRKKVLKQAVIEPEIYNFLHDFPHQL